MATAILSYLVVAVPALWLNRLDASGCRGKGFDVLVDGTPLLLVTLIYSAFLLMTGRSLFSGLLVIGGELLLFAVNRLKLSQFKEPLVFVDFGLFAQMLRHPRFYFPYIFPLPVVLAVSGLAALMGLLYWVQPPLGTQGEWFPKTLLVLSLAAAGFVGFCFSGEGRWLVRAWVARRDPSFDPNTDFARFGLTGSLLLHFLAYVHREGRDGDGGAIPANERSAHCVWPEESLGDIPEPRPHVVLVQAESFFDIRRVDPAIDQNLFANYDRLAGEGISGRMHVSAHGAYTMRTEFSVLTGIPNKALNSDGMNPYLTASRRPVWSLASHFKSQGYRCVFVHPYDLRFFRRDKVIPNLGFDELHGERVFDSIRRFGPYISDDALAGHILDLLDNSEVPVFVFAVTIEAHGPWDRERFESIGIERKSLGVPSWADDGFAAYLAHLRNTDLMLGRLAVDRTKNSRPRVVAMYGDHVGCVPENRCPEPDTDYLVWSGLEAGAAREDIEAEKIGQVVLEVCGKHKR
ncbi:MAG: LTA synthase family protein [Desulfovibrionaceae bacterium]|nr:LTA synthase family protein [Desulfovibrionaceae bacterium]